MNSGIEIKEFVDQEINVLTISENKDKKKKTNKVNNINGIEENKKEIDSKDIPEDKAGE